MSTKLSARLLKPTLSFSSVLFSTTSVTRQRFYSVRKNSYHFKARTIGYDRHISEQKYINASAVFRSLSSSSKLSLEYLEKAPISEVDSIAEVARQFLDGEREADDRLSEIRKWLTIAAEFGHTESAFLLGVFLVKNETTAIDSTLASKLEEETSPEERAASVKQEIKDATQTARTEKRIRIQKKKNSVQLDPEATQTISDYDLGLDWLRKASRKSHGKAMCYLGNILLAKDNDADVLEAVLWYEKAANLSNPSTDALFNLGSLYYDGKEGVIAKDVVKSFANFKRAADLGDLSSQFWVGYCYFTGEGVDGAAGKPRPQEALKYLKACVEAGHSSAMYYLATLHRSGLKGIDNDGKPDEVVENKELFIKYLIMAVEAEDPDALFCMGDLYLSSPENAEFENFFPLNEAKGRELYEKASELGHVEVSISSTYLVQFVVMSTVRFSVMKTNLQNSPEL